MKNKGYELITIQELKNIYKNESFLNNSIWNKY